MNKLELSNEHLRAATLADKMLDVPKFFCVWAFDAAAEDFTLRGVFSEKIVAEVLLESCIARKQPGAVIEETQQQLYYRINKAEYILDGKTYTGTWPQIIADILKDKCH